ncbi:class I SAM-dependent methyltransferase [Mucilaginibacter sp. CSA2-8R]|uniref:class I SAM-dependent methyltransferase n=1 Tax=Mucilaginibacter sp. CSA2-8R TaxID=3141542 RepID=UPI00315C50F4
MKDNFSTRSDLYAKFRPTYPDGLFAFLLSQVLHRENAWDCGTGNGQVAGQLATYFKQVYGTDISQQQLDNAVQLPNITYSKQPAEQTNFTANSFDLIVVAQAIHWFKFNEFYAEVKRTLKPGGVLAVMGYGVISITPKVDAVVNKLYSNIIGPFWDTERRYIDENYQTIPFPFEELTFPQFTINQHWTVQHLIGYLETWSAVKHYQKQNGTNPVNLIKDELIEAWGKPMERQITFPVLLRVGKTTA